MTDTMADTNSSTALDEFTLAYITCALWSTSDGSDEGGGVPLDDNFCVHDLHPDALAVIAEDCRLFQKENEEDIVSAICIRKNHYNLAMAGHDFWLTRNGHGVGFWDRGIGDEGDRLSAASVAFGEALLYVDVRGYIRC